MHLTLKFIGDVESSDIGDISSVVGNQVKDEVPFSLQLGKRSIPGVKESKGVVVGYRRSNKTLEDYSKGHRFKSSTAWIS